MKKIFANGTDEVAFLSDLKKRSGETNKKVTEVVSEIIENVKENGDEAVKNYTLKFDGSLPQYYEVPREVINDALTEADQEFVDALLNAQENIADFHQRQVEQSFISPKENGVIMGQRVRGLHRVGLYVPGGTAAYPSSVLMNAIPAKIAGVKEIMEDKIFGDSGNNVVVEEFLTGPEVSVLAFTDGKCVKPMVTSMDHKRALDGDKGLNTGGMGTVSPNPYYTDEIAEECMNTIFLPTIEAMNKEGRTFKGCLYFGLMLTPKGPKVIEYNCRFGDPETQVVLPRLKTDIMDIFEAINNETLSDLDIEWDDRACTCVIMASGGYPKSYPKGIEINGLTDGQLDGVTVYHAGTKRDGDKLVTSGGRVLGVTALGESIEDALAKSYAGVEKIKFDGAHYRKDIGQQALNALK